MDWSLVNYENTPAYSFNGISEHAKVLKVVDGDTFWLALQISGSLVRIKVRLAKCNAPEVGTVAGDKLKEQFKTMLGGEVVKVELGKWDKYGRALATIYYKDRNLLDIMREALPPIPEQDSEVDLPEPSEQTDVPA